MTDQTELQYTAEHEWIAVDGDIATIGITDYAADKLGDVVYVDLPDGRHDGHRGHASSARSSRRSRSASCSRRSNGEVVEANQAVVDAPELVNSDPFGDGWLIKVRRRACRSCSRTTSTAPSSASKDPRTA